MAEVQTGNAANQNNMQRFFVGRAWKNQTAKGEFLNIKLDKGAKLDGVDNTCTMQLWPNTKRPDKKDADYRLSILIPNAVAQA